MEMIPGPRTHPTVKSLAQTNQRSLRSWSISLGALQVSILLGFILGGLACTFYLGFFSGQKVGIEMALNNNLSAAMRLPIGGDTFSDGEEPLSIDEGLNDVYSKLKQLEDVPVMDAGAQETGSPADLALANLGLEASSGSAAAFPSHANAIESNAKAKPQLGVDASAERSMAIKDGNEGRVELGSLLHENSQPSTAKDVPVSPELKDEVNKPQAVKESARPPESNTLAMNDSARKGVSAVSPSIKTEKVAEPAKRAVETKTQQTESLIRSRLPSGWFAQVGAPDNRAEAEKLGRTLQKSGFPVIIETAKVRGQEYFRILVGPEGTRQQAERLMGQLKREPSVKADPFIRMVR